MSQHHPLSITVLRLLLTCEEQRETNGGGRWNGREGKGRVRSERILVLKGW